VSNTPEHSEEDEFDEDFVYEKAKAADVYSFGMVMVEVVLYL
jgi:hypothetical protein